MTFQRENRYIVIKRKDLDAAAAEGAVDASFAEVLDIVCDNLPTRECLVIESDWPEYEPAWRMIQARVEGATLSPAHIEEGEEVEVVATVCCSKDGDWYIDALHPSRVGEKGYLVEGDELMTVAQHQRIVAALQLELKDADEYGEREELRANRYSSELVELRAALSAPPAAVPAELTNVRCMCGDEYPHDSYGAGFIAGSGMCENCDAAIPAKEPPAAGVPEGWKLIPAQPNEAMLNQISPISGKEERLPYWWYQALIKSAPTPPAAGTTSDQYRAELYDEVWQKARDLGYGNVTDALVELERIKAAPPAAGVPEEWRDLLRRARKFVDAWDDDSQEFMDLCGDIDNALAAPAPPASEQQRAVGLDVIDRLRLELLPEYEAGYTAVAYGDSDQPVARADGMTAREAIAELLRLNPHLAKGEGV